ncbi:P-type conjugative transfer protein TrbL [Bordetella trematum]|uniref:P-type conjugative transfer protein TrbL n=1 Tax=Bordetella trematum TaxID=123899 RepID=UPI000D8C5493|nr:P-type conjugative transfer protein TrbL [Bordetella trematum]SPU51041.1 TrbL/VirB6 plasmid conjugal transfer protein [Bordetella trematum]VDH07296.1 conjugal transfer protein TrbL [Bordetella trematum]
MKSVLVRLGFGSALVLLSQSAAAAIEKGGVLNEVSDRFLTASSSWAGTITQYASWLFWTLVVISMVWTFGMMALRKADIGEFFAEFVRFTIFTGFFWWLLINGPNFAIDIVNSLRTIAAEASGLPRALNPSTPIDIAFDILAKAAKSYSVTSPIDNLSIFLTTLAILACMAVVAANVLLALITAWVSAYAGVFVLGFGGARWTSDIALNYFRSVMGIALKLMTITLLVGIAVSIIDGYHADLANKASMDELLVIFVVSLVLVILVNTIPNVIAGLIPGGGAAASAGSSFGAGAIMGAGMAAAGMATGGAALAAKATMGAATGAMGGASAVQAAMQKAAGSMSNGSDMPGIGSVSGNAGSKSDAAGTAGSSPFSSPFAQAAGFGGSGGGSGGGFSRAAKLAAGTVGELAKGAGAAIKQSAQQRVSETTGGKLAASIRASMEPPKANSTDATTFDGDSLGGADNASSGGGWINQTGGFGNLSEADQAKATESHAEWQAKSEGNTFSVEDYVSYVQERQQERNSEIDAFVNRDNRS